MERGLHGLQSNRKSYRQWELWHHNISLTLIETEDSFNIAKCFHLWAKHKHFLQGSHAFLLKNKDYTENKGYSLVTFKEKLARLPQKSVISMEIWGGLCVLFFANLTHKIDSIKLVEANLQNEKYQTFPVRRFCDYWCETLDIKFSFTKILQLPSKTKYHRET